VPATSHLLNRSGVFYWRRRVPQALASAFGRSHLVLSLRVREPAPARRLARRVSVRFDDFVRVMELERRTPTPDEQRDILKALYQVILEGCRDEHVSRYHHDDELPPEYFEQAFEEAAAEPVPEPTASADGVRFDAPSEAARQFRSHLQTNRFRPVRSLLAPLLASHGIDVATDDIPFRRFLHLALRVAIKAFDDAEAELRPDAIWDEVIALARPVGAGGTSLVPTSAPPAAPPARRKPAATPPAPVTVIIDRSSGSKLPTLRAGIERFTRQKSKGDWSPKSARDGTVAFRLLEEFFGDIPMVEITRERAEDFKEAISRLPKQHGKAPFEKLTLRELIDKADEIEGLLETDAAEANAYRGRSWVDDDTVIRLSLKTINKILSYAHGLFDAVLTRAELTARNPFDGLLYSKKVIERAQAGTRAAWSPEELQSLFDTPVWRGSQSLARRGVPGELVMRDGRFWVPLIGAFAGLRLEEACQLRVDDIEEIESLPCFFVRRGREQILKNAQSEREVPIHRTLVAAGFLDHVAEMKRRGEDRLFPELERAGPYKLLGYGFTKWFTEYRRTTRIYEPWLDFHALRHSFITNLKLRGRPEDQIAALVGHTRKGMTGRVYFKGFPTAVINETMQALDYGIGLSHVHRATSAQ